MRCLLSPVAYVHQLTGLEESSPAPGRLSVHSVSPKSGAIPPHYSEPAVDGDGYWRGRGAVTGAGGIGVVQVVPPLPRDTMASGQKFAERSRVVNGRPPIMWQIELTEKSLFLVGLMLLELGVDSLVVVVGAFLGVGVVGPMVGLGRGGVDQSAGM